MRVLHVVRSDGFAGVERHVATLASGQAHAGHQVAVVGGDQAQMGVALTGTTVRSTSGATVAEVVSKTRLLSRRVDVVHTHMTAAEVAAVMALPRAPIITTRHFARRRGASMGGRLASVPLRRLIARQIAVSGYVAGAVDGPSDVVYSGVPGRPVSTGLRKQTVLVIQRLQPEKETGIALKAFAAADVQGWRLQIAGQGDELGKLQELARGLGVDGRVDFLGHSGKVDSLMERAGVLFAPCRVEGLGMAVLEAMSHGLPVIASAAGAHLETVGQAAEPHLFQPGDWREAAELLTSLTENEEQRASYGDQLRMIQRSKFSVEGQVVETDRIYQEVLG